MYEAGFAVGSRYEVIGFSVEQSEGNEKFTHIKMSVNFAHRASQ